MSLPGSRLEPAASSHSPVAQCVQTKRRFVSCVGGGKGPGSDGLVQQRGDVLLLVPVRGTEHHHAILREAQHQQVGELSTAWLRQPGSGAPPRQLLGRGLCGFREQPQPIPAVPSLSPRQRDTSNTRDREPGQSKGRVWYKAGEPMAPAQLHHAAGRQLKGIVRKLQPTPLHVPHFTEQPSCLRMGPPIPAPPPPPPSCPGSAPCRCCQLPGATAAPLPSPSSLAGPVLTLMESA